MRNRFIIVCNRGDTGGEREEGEIITGNYNWHDTFDTNLIKLFFGVKST